MGESSGEKFFAGSNVSQNVSTLKERPAMYFGNVSARWLWAGGENALDGQNKKTKKRELPPTHEGESPRYK
jgi:hypothetical protein